MGRGNSTDRKRMNKICQFHWWDELGVNYLLQGKPHELGVNVKVFLMLEIFKNWSVQQYIEKYSSLLFAPRCHPLSTLIVLLPVHCRRYLTGAFARGGFSPLQNIFMFIFQTADIKLNSSSSYQSHGQVDWQRDDDGLNNIREGTWGEHW